MVILVRIGGADGMKIIDYGDGWGWWQCGNGRHELLYDCNDSTTTLQLLMKNHN